MFIVDSLPQEIHVQPDDHRQYARPSKRDHVLLPLIISSNIRFRICRRLIDLMNTRLAIGIRTLVWIQRRSCTVCTCYRVNHKIEEGEGEGRTFNVQSHRRSLNNPCQLIKRSKTEPHRRTLRYATLLHRRQCEATRKGDLGQS